MEGGGLAVMVYFGTIGERLPLVTATVSVAVVGRWPEVDAKHDLKFRESVYVGVGQAAQGPGNRGVVDAGGGGERPQGESPFGHRVLDGAGDGVCGDGPDGCVVSQCAVGEGRAGVGSVVGGWVTIAGGHRSRVAVVLAVLAFSSERWHLGGARLHRTVSGGANQTAQHKHTPPEGAPPRAHTEGTASWTTRSPFGAVSS